MVNTDIFFCGIKHSGKSTLGRLVSRRVGLLWRDADNLVKALIPKDDTIRSFYRREGVEAFRNKELEAIGNFLSLSHPQTIVSMGGGACDNAPLMERINQKGLTVYLSVPEEVLYGRVIRDGIPPFLDASRPKESFHALYLRRDELYGKLCSLVVHLPDTPDVEDSVRYLEKILQGARHGTQHIRH
ncbi:MAG: shikimate kinase [Sphaerochaetaceae bacterium]|nr:shikimate kinase [Spirochaetales bacterium]MDY5498956.1 shikimate kinase [Sphaerochaetaceae bacterium]